MYVTVLEGSKRGWSGYQHSLTAVSIIVSLNKLVSKQAKRV